MMKRTRRLSSTEVRKRAASLPGGVSSFVAAQLRLRASAVRDEALRAADIAAEIELQLMQGKVCADERDTVADEMEHERVYAQYCDDLSEQILFIAENIHTFIPESTDE